MKAETAQTSLPETFNEHRLLNGPQVQEMLGIKKTGLYRLLNSRKDPIPSLKIGGSRRFQLDKLLWWIEKHQA